jgi:hypothetical protein
MGVESESKDKLRLQRTDTVGKKKSAALNLDISTVDEKAPPTQRELDKQNEKASKIG